MSNEKEARLKVSPMSKDELLAHVVVIDGRKEWYFRFCTETNVWTRSKCQRCKTGIPSVLHDKHMQSSRSMVAADQCHRPQGMERSKF